MPADVGETVLFDNVAIRDTVTLTSAAVPMSGFLSVVLLTQWTLNQAGVITPQWSKDGVSFSQIGATYAPVASAGLLTHTETAGNLQTQLKVRGGFIRFTAVASVAPTAGIFTMILWKVGG